VIHRMKVSLRILSTIVFSCSFVLALAGLISSGPHVSYAAGEAKESPEKGHKVLYGFATARINLTVTAKINPRTGGFASVAVGAVPFFANSPAVGLNGNYLYVSNSFIKGIPNNGSQIFGYSIDSNDGTLTALPGSPFFKFKPPISIQGLAPTPDGRFLYGADASGHIYAFKVDSQTGVPKQISGSPFASGANQQLAVDPTGRFLYASDDNPPGGVLAFTIDSRGRLSPVPGSPFPIPDPSFLTSSEPYGIVDTGSFVYVALSASDRIAAFAVDRATGALTPVPGSPFAAGNSPANFALANHFLYVVNPGDGTVSGYSIDAASGALTPIPGSPFGSGGETIAMDPSGKYLFLGTFKGIQGYDIDPDSGVLTLGAAKAGENGALFLTTVQLP
jgi:6-phosphogluconolactonase